MSTVLGLDLGTNSIGWALIDIDKKDIMNTGVRIFPEGLNRIRGREESKNAQRRTARGMRRRLDRYQMRRATLQEYLKKHGFYPTTREAEDDFFKMDPYEIRKRGLDEKLSFFEMGRAFFHINQRRGFKSNRKTEGDDDNKIYRGYEGITGITDTEKAIKAGGYRTLGEYLANLDPEEQRRRNRFALRKMYEDELKAIWNKQKSFYSEKLKDEIRDRIIEIIIFQRKLKSQKGNVAKCTFEPDKKCSPKSSPVFQYFRMLETLSRIRITTEERYDEPLSDEERFRLVDELSYKEKMTFSQIKKLLGLTPDCHINLEEQKYVYGDRSYSALARAFGKKNWELLSSEKRYEIWHTLHFAEENKWLKEYASERWSLNEEQIKKLLKINLESGYARLSAKAMKKMIPHLEAGLTYDQACREAG